MNIFNKMDKIDYFTESESVFVEFMKEHPQDVIDLNMNELIKVSYVSKSTIYRVLDKLEISGMNELKLALARDYEDYRNSLRGVDYNYPFYIHNTHHQIMDKMESLYIQTIQSTRNLINLDSFLRVIQILKKSQNIYVYPSIGNIFMAESFQQSMLEIGRPIQVIKDSYYQHWTTLSMNKSDVVIMITYAEKTKDIFKTAKEIKDKGVTLILISSTYKGQIREIADEVLYFASYESSEEKIASFSSRLSLQYLLDCIYACYFNTDYIKHLDFKLDHYID